MHVLIADDEALVLKAFRRSLEKVGYEVSCCSTCQEVVASLNVQTEWDAIILDHVLPGGTADQLIPAVPRSLVPRIAVISAYFESEVQLKLQTICGVMVFNKPLSNDTLLSLVKHLSDRNRTHPVDAAVQAFALHYRLSPMEAQVLRWVMLGLKNAQIAQQLGNSASTVRTHLQRVCDKVGIQSKDGLIGLVWA